MNTPADDLLHQRVLALGALFQAATLAGELARQGRCDADAEAFLLRSVLVLDTDAPEAIYPELGGLRTGLRMLEACLTDSGRSMAHAGEVVRLVLGMLQVEARLRDDGGAQNTLRQRLQSVQRQQAMQSDLPQSALSGLLGTAYVDSLGQLPFRVQIRGDAKQLQSPGMPERIRAILLAGVRAAWLWQRLGGRRWHLLVFRGRLLRAVRATAKSV